MLIHPPEGNGVLWLANYQPWTRWNVPGFVTDWGPWSAGAIGSGRFAIDEVSVSKVELDEYNEPFSSALYQHLNRATDMSPLRLDFQPQSPVLKEYLNNSIFSFARHGDLASPSYVMGMDDRHRFHLTHILDYYRKAGTKTAAPTDADAVADALALFYSVAGYPLRTIKELSTPREVMRQQPEHTATIEGVIKGLCGHGRNLIYPPMLLQKFDRTFKDGSRNFVIADNNFDRPIYDFLTTTFNVDSLVEQAFQRGLFSIDLQRLMQSEVEMEWTDMPPRTYAWFLHKLLRFITTHTSAILFADDTVYFSLRPDELHTMVEDRELVDMNNARSVAAAKRRLHNRFGPAVRWRDLSMYAYKGITVPEDVVMRPHTITGAAIMGEKNAERRRVMVDLMGAERMLTELKAQIVHTDDFGVLYSFELPPASSWSALPERECVVKVTNRTPNPDGSFKDYYLRVPPNMRTAHQAVAWTFRMTAEQYVPGPEA